jgi:hypothetical protein
VSEARSPAGDVLPMALAPLVRVVTLAESGADAVGAVAALLDDTAALDGLGAAQRQAPAKVASLLVRLGARKGYRQFAGRLERAIREVATRSSGRSPRSGSTRPRRRRRDRSRRRSAARWPGTSSPPAS